MLGRKAVVLPIVVLLVLLSIFVVLNRPRSFTPKFESNTLSIVVKMNEQAGYEKTSQVVSELENSSSKGKRSSTCRTFTAKLE
jgi:HAE1 family hydrophobic/amphiphilic exporter-1